MIVFKNRHQLVAHLRGLKGTGKTLGFVPTMGALHEGHMSLLRKSKSRSDRTLCSVFVNPTQFNNPDDLEKYPVTLDRDVYLLEKNGADILFLPPVTEIYPEGIQELEHYPLGELENVLEGKYRPGHFQGVCQVMHRLLECVDPELLFMGQKDYQQCLIVAKLIALTGLRSTLVTCPIIREPDGLAMSSRNLRLNPQERKNAAGIYEALRFLEANILLGQMQKILQHAKALLKKSDFEVDYLEIVDTRSLRPLEAWDGSQEAIALIAAYQHDIRLIDNMKLSYAHN